MLKKILVFTWLSLSIGANAATVAWDVDVNGKLIGARNVNVDSTLYDVSFADDICINVFAGCNSTADFAPFTESSAALAAADALVNQVFLDQSGSASPGNYASEPGTIIGCGSTLCAFFIPYLHETNSQGTSVVSYADSIILKVGDNYARDNPAPDHCFSNPYDCPQDIVNGDIRTKIFLGGVYAQFELSPPSEVPLPAAAWLFGSALLGLGVVKRRKHLKAGIRKPPNLVLKRSAHAPGIVILLDCFFANAHQQNR
jgi:hypothetical protein